MMSFIVQLILVALTSIKQTHETQFIYNGFHGSINKLHLDGLATIHPNGLLQLTNRTIYKTSHAFYPHPVTFKPNHLSFSTTFIFAMIPKMINPSGNGITFVISPSTNFKNSSPGLYLGLLNDSTNGLPSNHIFAIELDTVQNPDFNDIDGNHVGVDVNSLYSINASSASYYSDKEGVSKKLVLNSGKSLQIWIDYDHKKMLLNVTLAPFNHPKPSRCLLSMHIDLSTILLDTMYIGFTSSSCISSNTHYLLGWSWNQSGKAQGLDLSKLPSVPRIKHHNLTLNLVILVVLVIIIYLLLSIIGLVVWFQWKKKYEELLEPWEKEYAIYRYSYKDLYLATKGFRTSELLGVGGFGKVYKGELPLTNTLVAVKRVISHESKQGMKEFVAEISSMSRLRHRNLAQLLGYCRRKGELLLVYEYMPNGSLDKFIFSKDDKPKLNWPTRFKIIKGVASGLAYLHEEWEQVVLHRDVKASNVLLDAEMNARLGDFGLARLYDQDIDPRTTHVVGTIGYIAPEVRTTFKPTTSTDVFAFGMFLLEVVCGRRPIGKQDEDNEDENELFFLSDWVHLCWKRGDILKASDHKMEGDYSQDKEKEMVLKLGLVCLNPNPEARPNMRQIVQFLNGTTNLPDIPSDYNLESRDSFQDIWAKFSSITSSYGTNGSLNAMSSTNSVLHYGR